MKSKQQLGFFDQVDKIDAESRQQLADVANAGQEVVLALSQKIHYGKVKRVSAKYEHLPEAISRTLKQHLDQMERDGNLPCWIRQARALEASGKGRKATGDISNLCWIRGKSTRRAMQRVDDDLTRRLRQAVDQVDDALTAWPIRGTD